MNIDTSFAARLYESARRLAPPEAAEPGGSGAAGGRSFAETLAAAADGLAENMRAGEQAARAALTGQGDVQSVVEALTATELALQGAVAIRDRVVEAYQEILRMPV